MTFRTQKKHMIDFLFPVALFFVFTVSALTVILLATNIYQSTTEHSSRNYTAGTSLSYIAEKIHQNDSGSIFIGNLDSQAALVMETNYENNAYLTYIYEYEGNLKELFIKKGVAASASAGTTILPVRSFSMEQISPQIFSFTCIDENGDEVSSIVSTHSTERSLL